MNNKIIRYLWIVSTVVLVLVAISLIIMGHTTSQLLAVFALILVLVEIIAYKKGLIKI